MYGANADVMLYTVLQYAMTASERSQGERMTSYTRLPHAYRNNTKPNKWMTSATTKRSSKRCSRINRTKEEKQGLLVGAVAVRCSVLTISHCCCRNTALSFKSIANGTARDEADSPPAYKCQKYTCDGKFECRCFLRYVLRLNGLLAPYTHLQVRPKCSVQDETFPFPHKTHKGLFSHAQTGFKVERTLTLRTTQHYNTILRSPRYPTTNTK